MKYDCKHSKYFLFSIKSLICKKRLSWILKSICKLCKIIVNLNLLFIIIFIFKLFLHLPLLFILQSGLHKLDLWQVFLAVHKVMDIS